MNASTRVGPIGMPALGVGTLGSRGAGARRLVQRALDAGYRHVDTGQYYANEEAVGEGLRGSGVPREEVWVTTKFLHPKSPPPDDLLESANSSLRRLRLEYVDAMLVHWPDTHVPLPRALEALTRFRDEGKARHIGVANLPSALLRDASTRVPDLAVIQVEYHPFLSQQAVLEVVREHDLVLNAHSPLARGEVLKDPTIRDIAASRGLSPAQVALRWLVQQDHVAAIPGGSPDHSGHFTENVSIFDFELSREEMDRLGALARGLRVVDPPHAPRWDG